MNRREAGRRGTGWREANLRALAASHPETAAAVAASGEAPGAKVLESAAGSPTLALDGIYLHGRHDPARDAETQARHEVNASATALIAIGFGLGYGAEAARRLFPQVPLLVVEPDPELFAVALDARDLAPLLSDPGVRWCVGGAPEGLPGVMEGLPLARPAFLRLRPAIRARPASYRPFEETIHSWLLRRDINVNTLNRFGRLWVRNLCRNMTRMARCPGVDSLRGLFRGIPALVLAGGPSLEDALPFLPALRERMLVICVNTPLRTVRAHGVEPDFTVVVDPQFWASRALDWTTVTEGVLVAEPSTCPRVFRKTSERFFLCSSLFPLGEKLEEAVGEKGRLGAGGSVSTSAWDLARILGARPLYASGLDLGFPGMRAHCRGSYAESLWATEADRFSPPEAAAFRSVRDIGLFSARSTGGGVTPTDRRMLLYKWWFENQLRMDPDLPSRTLSRRGVQIHGMPAVELDEVLALPVVRPGIERSMERVRRIHDQAADRASAGAKLTVALRELGAQLADLEALGDRGLAASRSLRALLAAGGDPTSAISELDRVDQDILALQARGIAGFLVQGVIHGIIGEGESPATPQEVAARSEAIYAGISESSRWQRRLIERAAADLAATDPGAGPERPAKDSAGGADVL